MTPNNPTNDSSADRAEKVIVSCLEQADANFENAVAALCSSYPDLAETIREQIEAAQGARLSGPSQGEKSVAKGQKSGGYQPIGPYQPLKELGRGGQGLVYLAEDTRLHRVVALKILKGFGPLSEKMMRRFKREAEVASKLDHPGICGVYDAGVKDGIPFIAMRYLEGKTLADTIRAAKFGQSANDDVSTFVTLGDDDSEDEEPRDLATTDSKGVTTSKSDVMSLVQIFEKAARALHAAHEAGIIHRDIKPANLIVTPSGEPVLLDFGLASEEANDMALTQTGDLFGTPAYMSPEQLMAQRIKLDRRTDIYSLAITMYECVTLTRPFDAPTREGMYQAIQYKTAPNVRNLNRAIPMDLKVVLEKAIEKDRDLRYSTALEFADDLKRVRHLEPVVAKPISTMGRLLRAAKRRPARAALILTLLIGVPLLAGMASYAMAKQPEIERARKLALATEVNGFLEAGFGELAHGDPAIAISYFDEALALDALDAEAIGGKAMALIDADQHSDCLKFIDQNEVVTKGVWAFDSLRIEALRAVGQEKESENLRQRTAAEPSTSMGFFLAGASLMTVCNQVHDKETFKKAQDYFTRALLSAPMARPHYHYQLIHTAVHRGDMDVACDTAETVLRLWPESLETHRWASYAFAPAGRYDEAITANRFLLKHKPDDIETNFKLGNLLMIGGRLAEAEAMVRKATEAATKNTKGLPVYYRQFARILIQTGKFKEAIEAIEKSIELDPTNVDARCVHGFAHEKNGDLVKARQAYAVAVQMTPELRPAFVQLASGQMMTAIRGFHQAQEDMARSLVPYLGLVQSTQLVMASIARLSLKDDSDDRLKIAEQLRLLCQGWRRDSTRAVTAEWTIFVGQAFMTIQSMPWSKIVRSQSASPQLPTSEKEIWTGLLAEIDALQPLFLEKLK